MPAASPHRPLRALVRLVRALAAAAVLAALGLPAVAQTVPSRGDWFEETAEYGFRVRVPKDWRFIPPNLDDPMMIAKYVPGGRDWAPIGGGDPLWVWGWVLRFDLGELKGIIEKRTREQLDLDEDDPLPKGLEKLTEGLENLDSALLTWLGRSQAQGSKWALVESRTAKNGKHDIEERIYEGKLGAGANAHPVRVYIAVLQLGEQRYAATAFNGPGAKGDWTKHENGFKRLGRTLEPIGVAAAAEAGSSRFRTLRDDKRTMLAAKIAQMPGWWMHETANYFIITDSSDKRFVEELGDRLEAIRKVYEADYPYEKARVYQDPAKAKKKKKKPDGGGDGAGVADAAQDGQDGDAAPEDEEADVEDDGGSFSVRNSFELSRCSVVRVCSDREMYHSYGGPGGSAGYWSSYHEELVVYDDKAVGGRSDTWSVVNHEAFHQYIFYFYGNIAPHSWYNEGTGDFYAGYEYNAKRKRFTLTPFDWRRSTARDLIRDKRYAPLREFVRWSQREYYGSNEYGLGGGENYALGWSFIWFLRTGKEKSKRWNPRWDTILDTYLAALAETGDLDDAVDAAFEGVDWAELESAWSSFSL